MRRVTIFKWQLNLLVFITLVMGIVLGTYFGATKIFKALAVNDTTKTWTYNAANSALYTYDSALVDLSGSNAKGVSNLLLNNTLDIDLASWTGTQQYLLRDEFDDTRASGSVNGTAATPGPGTRAVTDTNNKLDVSNGAMNFATGGSAAGNPGVWYGSVNRGAGKILICHYKGVEERAYCGWDNNVSGPLTSAVSLNPLIGSSFLAQPGSANVGAIEANTDYYLAVVLKASGAYMYVKGGAYTNWTLLWINYSDALTPLYPAIAAGAVTSVFNSDFIRFPEVTWVPTPLIYDSFNRADGNIGSTEASGPENQTVPQSNWSGSTWQVSGNKAVNSPVAGDEMWDAPASTFESGTYAWTKYLNNIMENDAGSLKITYVDGSYGATEYLSTTADLNNNLTPGTWYQLSLDTKVGAGNSVALRVYDGANTQDSYTETSTTFTPHVVTFHDVSPGSGYIRLTSFGAGETYWIDNLSLKPLSFNSLFSSVSSAGTDVVLDANITQTKGTQTGFILNLDSAENPQNYVLVYYDGSYVHLDKMAAGTLTLNLINSSASYVAGFNLRVIKVGSKYRVYYNNTLMGTEVSISDLGIVNNDKYGLFSTYSGNSIDNFSIFPRGTNGEYNDLPAEELTATRDTGIKYSGGGSAKLVTAGNNANFVQSINVGDTSTYDFITYAYTNGGAVTANDLKLFYNGSEIPTTFAATATSGWYKLSGTITGIASSKEIGVRVKAGKTVYVDEFLLYRQGNHSIYTTSAYSNDLTVTYDSFTASVNTPGNSQIKYQICTDDGSVCESGGTWKFWNGSVWTVASNMMTDTNTSAQLTRSVMQQIPVNTKKISVKAIMYPDSENIPSLSTLAIGLTTDTTPPVNATDPLIYRTSTDTCTDADNCWTGLSYPKFTWTDGSDAQSGMKGYCLYLGTDIDGNPAESKGKLGTSPVSITDTPCQFIVSTPELNLASDPSQLGTALSNSDTFITAPNTYFLKIKAIDIAGNPSTDPVTIRFQFDGTRPTNVSYISTSAGNFSNVVDMSFSWPTGISGISTDDQSDVLGWQYQINGTEVDGWKGTTHSDLWDIDYIPVGTSLYQLTQQRDGDSVVSGNNIVYFRTVDNVGNFSSDATVRTGNLSFGGEAPYFGGTDKVTVSPSENTTNSFSLSWPTATANVGNSVTHYYYSINTLPASTLVALQSNVSTFIDNGTSTTVDTRSLPNVNKDSNVVYVVAIDDAATPNYSPSNYITGTFTLDSSNPDNVGNLVASDVSIKSQQKWNVALSWTLPVYQGAGNLVYQIYRSSNGINFTQVGTSSGLSYVDSVPSSSIYYYKVYTKDGANALSSGSNAVSITPTGRWTEPPALESDPMVTSITTKKAVIAWSTDRTSDSKVAFGTKSGIYNTEEPSNSEQVTGHTITLSGLNPSTTYYYVSKWTDEDGNTGVSEEGTFKTDPAPVIKTVSVSNVGLSSAIVKFTSTGASKVKVYYGKTTAFGGVQQIATSPVETTYTVQLTGLDDGTKYYFKLNKYDSEGTEYEGDTYTLTTLPRPKISNVVLQEIVGTSQTTILVTWNTNTSVSSIVTYYPEGKIEQARDEVVVNLTSGEHKMIIRGLLPQTNYYLTVKGRDKVGNEAESDSHKFTTSTDSRPPFISGVTIEGSTNANSSQETTAQLIISWTTDEPATSQVEYGEGTGITYQQRSQLDSKLTLNHIVIISGLTPSKVYHLRVISNDKAGNIGKSIDTVTIAPKSTDNALNLVITNLQQIFGIFGK